MVWPSRLLSKAMVSPLWAAAIVSRSEPGPKPRLLVTVRVLGSQRSSRASRQGRKDRCFRAMGNLRVMGGRPTASRPRDLRYESGRDHAHGAIVDAGQAEVVQVGPERSGVAGHDAVVDRQ